MEGRKKNTCTGSYNCTEQVLECIGDPLYRVVASVAVSSFGFCLLFLWYGFSPVCPVAATGRMYCKAYTDMGTGGSASAVLSLSPVALPLRVFPPLCAFALYCLLSAIVAELVQFLPFLFRANPLRALHLPHSPSNAELLCSRCSKHKNAGLRGRHLPCGIARTPASSLVP